MNFLKLGASFYRFVFDVDVLVFLVHILVFLVHILAVLSAYLHAYFYFLSA